MNTRERHVLHIDMNAFYCSCHAAAEPEKYRGKPTAVAGSPETRHGVLVTASYEARRYGVRATMTVAEALRKYSNLILIYPDFDLYRAYSKNVFELVRQYTPVVEIMSIDECFADITGSGQFGTPRQMAEQIQQRILNELGLPCSIGVAPNRFLAKMASDFQKPLGITELWQDRVKDLLWPMPVGEMFGVGEKTAERLERLGIHTIEDLAKADPVRLHRSLGKRGGELVHLANGQDHSVVNPIPEPLKSIGHSMTLTRDLTDTGELCTVLLNLSDQVGRRVRKHEMVGKTVQITIRYGNRETVTRAKTLSAPICLTEQIYETACELLIQHRHPSRAIRLLGVTLGQLQAADSVYDSSEGKSVQLNLFEAAEAPVEPDEKTQKLRKLSEVTDALRNKFGENALVRGRMLTQDESGQIRNRKIRGTSLQKDNLQ